MNTPKLMVVSHPCLEAVNRGVFRWLANEFGVAVHLVVPSFNDVGDGYKACAPIENEPFAHTLLEPRGRHLRLRTLKGLPALVREVRPTHLLIDADPSTRIVTEMLSVGQSVGARVWSLTAENLPRNYTQEAWQQLRSGRLKAALSGFLTQYFFANAVKGLDRLFTISRDGTRAMEGLGFKGRVTQIPLGFDPQLFFPKPKVEREAIRRELGLSEWTVAYFGRLSPEKGIHLLFEALGRLKGEVRFQILLDHFAHAPSPYIESLKTQLQDLGLADRAVFFHSAHQDMPKFMNAADVVVLPSVATPKWKEQYGRVLPEAMACGRIAVGSSSGTIPELIGDAGFVFPEGDTVALAEALRKISALSPKAVADLSEKSAARAAEGFSLTTQAAIWAECLGVQARDKKVDKIRATQ